MKANPVDTIPAYNAKAESWIEWHKTLKSNFGKKVANSLWTKAWSIRGYGGANTSDLREYMEGQGVKINKSAWDSVVDFGGGILDFFGDAFTVAKWVGISLLVIIVGGIGMIIFNIARKPAESAGIAARAFVTKGK